MNKIEQVRAALTKALGFTDSYQTHGLDERYRAESSDVYDKLRAALAILNDMDAQEPVAWMAIIRYPDGDDSLVYSSTREGAVQMGYERTRVTGTVVRVAPLYAHPSPSAPVDIAEVIKAGEEVVKKLWEANDMACIGPNPTDTWHAEKNRVISAWTTATDKHRTA